MVSYVKWGVPMEFEGKYDKSREMRSLLASRLERVGQSDFRSSLLEEFSCLELVRALCGSCKGISAIVSARGLSGLDDERIRLRQVA